MSKKQKISTFAQAAFYALVICMCAAAPPVFAEPGGTQTATTIWWVVFNHPEHCATVPCSEADLFVEAVEASVFNASGALVGADGRAQYVAALYETSEDFSQITQTAPATSLIGGPGLVDSQTAEIHIVVRTHGPAIEGLESQQITVYLEPGCTDLGGPNDCVDIQFAIHQPGGEPSSSVWRFEDGSVVSGARSTLIRGDGFVNLILDTRIK